MDPVALATLAEELARAAGAVLVEHAKGPLTVETKSSSTDMVSGADRAAEELIRARLHAARPDDAVLGEEGGDAAGSSGLRWIVDPLDGTTNYLYRLPIWSVSIAVEDAAGRTLAGCVHDPSRDETFTAARGYGARRDGAPVRVSGERLLAQSLVATGFAYDAPTRRAQALVVEGLIGRVRDIRRLGSAAIDLCWTACGRYDAYYESDLNPWDLAAGRLIAEEAGARTTDVVGAGGLAPLVVSTPAIHDELVALVGAAPPASPVG